jgi:hypothetical protein
LPDGAGPAAVAALPSTRVAFGLPAAATASATMVSGSLMARLTPDAITGLPAKR